MHQRGTSAAPRGEALGRHLQHGVEVLARQVAVRPRTAHQLEQIGFRVLAACRLRDDLLRQHVERRVLPHDRVELSAAHRAEQGRAFEQIVARRREDPPFGNALDGVSRSSHSLQGRGDPARRPYLAHEIHVPDVDAELERRRRHERAQAAGLEPHLGVEARLPRETAVMRGHLGLAQPLAEMTGHPFGHPPSVDENQRRPVLADQLGQPVVVLRPDLLGHHRVERRTRDLDPEIHRAPVSFVDNRAAARLGGPNEIARNVFDRLLCRRKSQAEQRLLDDLLQPFERQREVGAAAGADHGVDLVDDHRPHGAQHLPAAIRGQEEIERLGGRDENVRRMPQHRGPRRRGRISRANGSGDARCGKSSLFGELPDPPPRFRKVLVDVGAERFQRRHVNDADLVRERTCEAFLEEVVDRRQERRERLAGSGRCGNQRVASFRNGRPAARLRRSRLADLCGKPLLNERMEFRQGHRGND